MEDKRQNDAGEQAPRDLEPDEDSGHEVRGGVVVNHEEQYLTGGKGKGYIEQDN
jgi:hypothetical protein